MLKPGWCQETNHFKWTLPILPKRVVKYTARLMPPACSCLPKTSGQGEICWRTFNQILVGLYVYIWAYICMHCVILTLCDFGKIPNNFKLVHQTRFFKSLKMYAVQPFHPEKNSSNKRFKAPKVPWHSCQWTFGNSCNFFVVVVFCFKLSILLPNLLFLFSLLCTALCDWLSMKSA